MIEGADMSTTWIRDFKDEGWTCFKNVDAINNVWCPYCGAAPGHVCIKGTRGPRQSDMLVHAERAGHFMRWALHTKFVPNNLIGENDKDLIRKAAE